MQMIRKQLYITREQQRKLRKPAEQWGCSEAEVVRRALDRLPDPGDPVVARLAAAGMLVTPPDDPDLPQTDEELEALEREHEEWLAILVEPLGLPRQCWRTVTGADARHLY
jgi:hypothetical protein